jgi:hypothetical protein
MTTVSSVSVSLNQVARAGAGARADHRSFASAHDRTADGADTGADQCSFKSAVVHAAITPRPPLCVDIQASDSERA